VPQVVAIVCSLGLLAFAAYQLVLLSGVPVARFAWGGEDHYLQPQHRTFARLSILGCAVAIFVALQGAGIGLVIPALAARVACYVFVAALFTAFILTARSRSQLERRLMMPAYLVLSALFLILALAGNPGA
jgi:hypothetical protein